MGMPPWPPQAPFLVGLVLHIAFAIIAYVLAYGFEQWLLHGPPH